MKAPALASQPKSARSSVGSSTCLLSRLSGVRSPPGRPINPFKSTTYKIKSRPMQSGFRLSVGPYCPQIAPAFAVLCFFVAQWCPRDVPECRNSKDPQPLAKRRLRLRQVASSNVPFSCALTWLVELEWGDGQPTMWRRRRRYTVARVEMW